MCEAANINTSLMTLGRCIEVLRHNQHIASTQPPPPQRDDCTLPPDSMGTAQQQKPHVVPFRESRLTHLFWTVLSHP